MFSASGSFTDAYKHLYDKASRALFKLKQINVHSNVPVALKLFDSLVAPIVTYCSEIWGAFLFKLIPDNDFFSACEQFPIECLLTKFAKYLLRVRRRSCNAAVRGELGLYPLLCRVIFSVTTNWRRIVSCESNSLIRRSYLEYCHALKDHPAHPKSNCTKNIKNMFEYFDHAEIWHNQGYKRQTGVPNSFKSAVLAKYKTSWHTSVQNNASLRSYFSFKKNFALENYLLFLPIVPRSKFSKLRISAHHLHVETGRHKKPVTPVHLRICSNCDTGAIEDEQHVLIDCPHYSVHRDSVFKNLSEFTDFNLLKTSRDKFTSIMSLGASDTEYMRYISPLIDVIMTWHTSTNRFHPPPLNKVSAVVLLREISYWCCTCWIMF